MGKPETIEIESGDLDHGKTNQTNCKRRNR